MYANLKIIFIFEALYMYAKYFDNIHLQLLPSNSSSAFNLLSLPPSFMSFFPVLIARVHLMLAYWAIHWSMSNSPVATTPQESGSSSHNSHQLPVVPQLTWGFTDPSLIHPTILIGLIWGRKLNMLELIYSVTL